VPVVLGVDEAGRGAVLGPMVVAGVAVEGGLRTKLRHLGARDSKSVPRQRRREIVRRLMRESARGWAVVYPALQVDSTSLTVLEEDAIRSLIKRLRPEQVVIDAPVGPTALAGFLGRVRTGSATPVEISAYPKADVSDPLVSAASLLAKVVRDGYLEVLRARYGDIGWGYPGEQAVHRFLSDWLAEHGSFPPFCRTRWASAQALLSPRLPL